MVNALISRLTNRITWKLLAKVFFFGLGLLGTIWLNFNVTSLVLFFIVLLCLYWSEAPERRQVRFSFWLVPILTLFVLKNLGSPWVFLALLLSLSAFFIVLALSHLLFKNQFLFYEILNTMLIFTLAALYFNADRRVFFENLFFFGTASLLLIETFEFFGFIAKKRKLLTAASLGLIALELVWLLDYLPLGVLNSAVFLTLAVVLIRDGLAVYRGGHLSRNFFLRELALFVVLSTAIFAASSWRI